MYVWWQDSVMRQMIRNTFLMLVLGSPLGVLADLPGEITLPQDSTSYQANDLPGYPLVLKNCLTCHSSQYVQTQPPGSPRTYWNATVHKMQQAFKAPIPDEEIPAIVDYLTKTYGAEK